MSAPFATLVDYWFGELPASEEAAFEEHLFGCGECTAKLEDLEALGAAVRAAWREGSADDFVVSRLSAPLQGVRRLDLITTAGRFEDVPFDAEAGEVLVCPAPALLKKKGAYTHHMRLVAVEDEGERVLGDYAFSHSPS
jgi:hypothetical protein